MIKLIECRKIYGDGKHNAFTNIVKWRDYYYLGFRHASSHISMDGTLYIFRSADLKKWEKICEISSSGKDLRGAAMLPGEKYLLIYTLARTAPTDTAKDRITFFCRYDGIKWSGLMPVEPNLAYGNSRFWKGTWYVAGHHYVEEDASSCFVDLLVSDDGESWKKVSRIYTGDSANETELWFFPDGELLAAVRREKDPKEICLCISSPPYENWTKYETGICLQGPAIGEIGKRVFLLGRHWKEWKGPHSLTLFEIQQRKKLVEEMNLPAGKFWDFSYASFLKISLDETVLTYYSGHQDLQADGTSIFLARMREVKG